MKNKKLTGFTIVELLIVIVVIGILAALVLNSFSQAQVKARNAYTIDTVKKYIAAIRAHGIDKGRYPLATDTVAHYNCLGEGYPNNNCASQGVATHGIGTASNNATLNNELRPYMSNANPLPVISTKNISYYGEPFIGGYYILPANGTVPSIIFFLEGDVSCGSLPGGNSSRTNGDDGASRCDVSFPPL